MKSNREVADEIAEVVKNLKGDSKGIAEYVYKQQYNYVKGDRRSYLISLIQAALDASVKQTWEDAALEADAWFVFDGSMDSLKKNPQWKSNLGNKLRTKASQVGKDRGGV